MIIGIGCDIIKIERITKYLNKNISLNFLTDNELKICNQFSLSRKAEWIAGRFAAKEAIYKACHNSINCTIYDFEVLQNDDGSPYCKIENYIVHLSISHEKEYAIAYAIVESMNMVEK